jgi:hypothetical protein
MTRWLLSVLYLSSWATAQTPAGQPAPDQPNAQPPRAERQDPQPNTPAKVGSQAPDIRLNDHTGKLQTITAAGTDGAWTVLAFYPKASTPG